MIFWASVFCLTGFWIFGVPFLVPDPLTCWVFLAAGLVLSCLGRRGAGEAFPGLQGSRIRWMGVLCGSLYVFLMPSPYRHAGVALAAGLLFPSFGAGWIRRLRCGLLTTASVLYLQQIGIAVYYVAAPDLRAIPGVAPVASGLLNLLGVPASATLDTLFVTHDDAVAFLVSPDKLGLFPALLLFLGGSAGVGSGRQAVRGVGIGILLIALYLPVRFLVALVLVLQFQETALFWSPWATLATFLPLLPLLSRVSSVRVNLSTETDSPPAVSSCILRCNPPLGLTLLSGALVFFLLVAVLYRPEGIDKPGRVVFDESHSDWEWTFLAPSRNDFSDKSMYNYHAFRQHLGHFFRVETTSDTLTAERLGQCDVVILKTPTRSYSEVEVERLTEFVRNGGGLILIGDHTNIFGSSRYLNPIAERFGMHFNFDATFHSAYGGITEYRTSAILRHPILARIPSLLVLTSCTLDVGWACERVMVGHAIRIAEGDYGEPHFFPRMSPWLDYRFGIFHQAAAVRAGKGRVVAFGDSTMFSNFAYPIPYRSPFALNMVSWANRTSPSPWPRRLGIVALLFLNAAAWAWLSRRGGLTYLPLAALLLIGTLPASLATARFLTAASMPTPREQTPLPRAIFERQFSTYSLSGDPLVRYQPRQTFYDEFYCNALRVGLMPEVSDSLSEALDRNPPLLVMINPASTPSGELLQRLKSYVGGGGTLLLLDNCSHKASSARAILSVFAMDLPPARSLRPREPPIHTDGTTEEERPVDGESLARFRRQAISVTRWGAGRVAAFGSSGEFAERGTTRFLGGARLARNEAGTQPFQVVVYEAALEARPLP